MSLTSKLKFPFCLSKMKFLLLSECSQISRQRNMFESISARFRKNSCRPLNIELSSSSIVYHNNHRSYESKAKQVFLLSRRSFGEALFRQKRRNWWTSLWNSEDYILLLLLRCSLPRMIWKQRDYVWCQLSQRMTSFWTSVKDRHTTIKQHPPCYKPFCLIVTYRLFYCQWDNWSVWLSWWRKNFSVVTTYVSLDKGKGGKGKTGVSLSL